MTEAEAIRAIREAIRWPNCNTGDLQMDREIMAMHRDQWPSLWRALDALMACEPKEEKRTMWTTCPCGRTYDMSAYSRCPGPGCRWDDD